MTQDTNTQGQVPEALQEFEVRKLAAIGLVHTSSGLVERRPIEYRRELEDQFVRGYRAAEKRLHAQVAALTQPAQVNTKTHDLLSMMIGLFLGAKETIGYKPGGAIDNIVAEAVEHLKDWPYPDTVQVSAVESNSAGAVLTDEDIEAIALEQIGFDGGLQAVNGMDIKRIVRAAERKIASRGPAPAPADSVTAPASVLHLAHSAFAEIAMAFPKAYALHKVGIADTAVREALAAPAAQADSQPAPDEIINMAREQGLPETETEGVFIVNVDDLGRIFAAYRAARAPADSVTAPAGGAVSAPVFAFRRKGLDDFCTCTEERYAELSAKPNLFETRIFYTTPPAQAADSVLEDAARLDWLLLRISGAEFRRLGVHYSGNARRADVDAARKQGGAT